MQRIIRAISTRHHAGGLCAPAPIVSRIFQELSNGMLAYNQVRGASQPCTARACSPRAHLRLSALCFFCNRIWKQNLRHWNLENCR
eukprot:4954081-Pleurochrysis_carterae.AAC.1